MTIAAAAMSSVVRVASCTGSTQDKRILHSLMALHAAKIFVAVESSSRGAVASAALKTKTSLVREEECSVGAFCSLYSTFSEVSTRGLSRVAARSSAAATNGGEFIIIFSESCIRLTFLRVVCTQRLILLAHS